MTDDKQPRFRIYVSLDADHLLTAEEALPNDSAEKRQAATPADVIAEMKLSGGKYQMLVSDWNLIDMDDAEITVVDADNRERSASW